MTGFAKIQIELKTVMQLVGLLSFGAFLLASAGVTYMLFFDAAPPFVSLKARMFDQYGFERYVYRPGEIVHVRRDFCVDRTIPVQIGRNMRNVDTNDGIYIDSSNGLFVKGCSEGGNIIVLPSYAPPGKYRYDVSVRYSNNPFQEAGVLLAPVFFEIVK